MRPIPHHLHDPAIDLPQAPRIHSQELVLDRPDVRLAILHRGAAPGRAAAVRAAAVPRRAEEIHGAARWTGHGEGLVRGGVLCAPEVGFWDQAGCAVFLWGGLMSVLGGMERGKRGGRGREGYGGEGVEGDHYGGAEGTARTREVAEAVVAVEFLRRLARVDLDGVEGGELIAGVEEVVIEGEDAGENGEFVEDAGSGWCLSYVSGRKEMDDGTGRWMGWTWGKRRRILV